MKHFIFLFINIIFNITISAQETEKCITGDVPKEHDYEFSLGLYQVSQGYLFGDLTKSSDLGFGIAFYERGCKIGFNPWSNCILLQTTQSIGLGFFSFEIYLGLAKNLSLSKVCVYLAPSFNVSFKYFDLAYSYSFKMINDIEGFLPKSNLSIKIPVFSSCGFIDKQIKKTWHWGEAHHGIYWY